MSNNEEPTKEVRLPPLPPMSELEKMDVDDLENLASAAVAGAAQLHLEENFPNATKEELRVHRKKALLELFKLPVD